MVFAQINFKVFKNLVRSYLMGAARHAWSTQNNNYAISLQCLKKVVSDEVDFLHADPHLNFLQGWYYLFYSFYVFGQACLKYKEKVIISLWYLKNEVRNAVDLHKLILSFLTGVASMSKIPKITSLQYLANDMLDYLDFR